MADLVRGTTYNREQVEYQYFPEEYFSGSDISIHFGDTHIDEITSIQFGLEERVAPIFGYNSYTFDAAARGQRVAQGAFTIAFKEAGYLHRVLDHIGQLTYRAQPKHAYDLGENKSYPQWIANPEETIDELLDRANGAKPKKQVLQVAPSWGNMTTGAAGEDVKQLQKRLRSSSAYNVSIETLTKNMSHRPVGQGYVQRDAEVSRLQHRLNEYLYYSGAGLIDKPLNASGLTFDKTTENAVKLFQQHFSTSLSADGFVGPLTRAALNAGLTESGTFDAATKLAVMKLQSAKGLAVDGSVGPATRAGMEVTVDVPHKDAGKSAEASYAEYEANIWAGTSKFDTSYKDNPHFYGTEKQAWLLREGFDIFINYGQLPQTTVKDGKVNGYISHNTTVKAIRNVQLTGVQQVIGPTGEAIAETYHFIAKDIE